MRLYSVPPASTAAWQQSLLNPETMSTQEEVYLGLLVITIFWALFSGACVVVSSQAGQRTASGVWASSFGATSLVAAYCFGMLL
jgi:hypothetical protein